MRIEYRYTPANRLDDEAHYLPEDLDTPVRVIDYAYDEKGRLAGYDDGETSATYGYDDLNRKTAETIDYGDFELSYAYTTPTDSKRPTRGRMARPPLRRPARQPDPRLSLRLLAGRQHPLQDHRGRAVQLRVSSQNRLPGRRRGTRRPGLGNRLTSADIEGDWAYDHNNGLLSVGDRVLDYDENGNQTLRGAPSDEQTLVYDTNNRLVQVENSEGDVLAEYYYGPFGRRLWKEVGGQRTYFFYAEEGLAAEIDASGEIQKTYGYWPGGSWTTNPLFQKIGSEYYW